MSRAEKLFVFPEKAFADIPRVKIKVINALLDLVKEKDFDKVTVKDIYTRAGIAKSTFYDHFSDKFAIMQWHYNLITDVGTAEIGRTLTWEEGHLITTAGIEPMLPLYDATGKSASYEGLFAYSARKREADIYETLLHYRHVPITNKLAFQISALVAGEQVAARENFHQIVSSNVYDYVDFLISIVPKDLYEALKIEPTEQSRQWGNPWNYLYIE